jgi:hypothetical protein
MDSILENVLQVLRKYLNQSPVIYRQFDKNKFRDLLCAAQQYARSSNTSDIVERTDKDTNTSIVNSDPFADKVPVDAALIPIGDNPITPQFHSATLLRPPTPP